MRSLPKGIDPNCLPDIAHHRGHGIDRVRVWCLTRQCFHQAHVTFADLATYGGRETTTLWDLTPKLKCTKCGRQNAELQPDWSQASQQPARGINLGCHASRSQVMPKRSLELIVFKLTAEERVFLFCVASGTDWTRIGIPGGLARNMVIKDTVDHDRAGMRFVLTKTGREALQVLLEHAGIKLASPN
jgi:hypothetical protein